jgi:inorganic pyrophosphatase
VRLESIYSQGDGVVRWQRSDGGMTAPAEDRALASAISTQTVECVVEIPKGSRNKYEYDQELGAIKLDRFVSASVVYPTDYGFIPETLSLDGDPLDVMICVSEPTFPGCVVLIKPIALLEMEDEHGVDPHVLGVPVADPLWNSFERLEDLPPPLAAEISHFFVVYKDLDPAGGRACRGG